MMKSPPSLPDEETDALGAEEQEPRRMVAKMKNAVSFLMRNILSFVIESTKIMGRKVRFTIRAKLALVSVLGIGAAVSILGVFLGVTFRGTAFDTAESTLKSVSDNAMMSLDHSVSSVDTSMNLLANQIGYNTDFANSIETVSTDEKSLRAIRTAISGTDGSGDGSTIAGAMDYLVVSEDSILSATMYSPFVHESILSRLYPVANSKIKYTEKHYNELIAHPGRSLWFFQGEELYVWKALVNFGIIDNYDMKVVGYIEYEFDKNEFLQPIIDTQYENEGMILLDEHNTTVLSLNSGDASIDKTVREKVSLAKAGMTRESGYTIAKSDLSTKGWTYITYINHKSIEEVTAHSRNVTIIIVAISVVVAGAITIILSEREISRIKSASRAAQAISQGDYSVRVPIKGNDELTDQAHSINIMGENIQSLIGELKELNQTLILQSDSLTENFATVVSNKSGESGYHVRRVSVYSEILARTLGFDEEKCHVIKVASTLHDIGKLLIDDAVLHKPGRFTDEERAIMQQHVVYGAQILNNVPGEIMETGAKIALYHHERWDGQGYVNGLKGDEIPIEAQIASVADVFDALISKRCYKNAWTIEDAYNEIVNGSGTQFSPRVVEAFKTSFEDIKATALHYKEAENE